jgi:hypothetical protein
MGFKLALNFGLEIGTKLALSLAEKNLTYGNPLEEGGGGGVNLALNLTLNSALNLSFKLALY